MTIAGRDRISDAAFEVLLRDTLDRISLTDIDAFSREQLCQALRHYEVPYNDRSRTKTLVNTLLKHRTSRINARRADEEEEETPRDPDAPLVPLPGEDDGNHTGANLVAVQRIVDELRNDIKSQLTELRDSLSRDISTVNSNTITRFNGVRDTALDVYKEEINKLSLPTNQSVLQSIDLAIAPLVSNINLLHQNATRHDSTLVNITGALDQRVPGTPSFAPMHQPPYIGALVSMPRGGEGTTTSTTASAPGGVHQPPRPHPLFPEIDLNTGQRIQRGVPPAGIGNNNTGVGTGTGVGTPGTGIGLGTTPAVPPLDNPSTPRAKLTNPYAPAVRRQWSPLNEVDAKRSEAHCNYLGGNPGYVDGLSEIRFLELGFNVHYFFEIRDALATLVKYWDTPVFNVKYKDNFHPLSDISVESWVDFYTHLQADVQSCHIGMVPFDALLPSWGYIGLVLPGIGADRYLPMARCLYNILERLLPVDHPTIRMCNDSASGYTMDGFRWLHGIFTQFVPGFCPYVSAAPPVWSEVGDIAQFAKLYNLYYRLQALQSIYHTEVIKSRAFLQAISEETYRPSIISLDNSIVNYNNNASLEEFSIPGELPLYLTIDGLAASLIKSASPLTGSMSLSSHRTMVSLAHSSPGMDLDYFPATFGSTNYSSRQRAPVRKRIGTGSGGDQSTGTTRSSPRRSSSRPAPTPDGDTPVVYCDACDEKHPTEKCWKVARALRVQRFIKKNLGRDILAKIDQAYAEHFGLRSSAHANATSAAFLEAYCAQTGLSGQEIADQFDWDWLASTALSSDEEPEESN